MYTDDPQLIETRKLKDIVSTVWYSDPNMNAQAVGLDMKGTAAPRHMLL